MKLSHSLQDYLETILILERKNSFARVKEIANLLNVQMPSVTGALKNLRQKGLINYEKNSYITLTDTGLDFAQKVLDRHKALSQFLKEVLLMSETEADAMACKIEHSINKDTKERLERLSNYLKTSIIPDLSIEQWEKIIVPKED